MDLNSMLRDMGLVDAFSTALAQVDIELAPGACSGGCEDGCSGGCKDGCSGGCSGSNKG